VVIVILCPCECLRGAGGRCLRAGPLFIWRKMERQLRRCPCVTHGLEVRIASCSPGQVWGF
jgi:hypothetical protein